MVRQNVPHTDSPPSISAPPIFMVSIHLCAYNQMQCTGKGGYGRVFIARDLRSKGTTAAIKVLNKV